MRKDVKANAEPVRRRHVWKSFSTRIGEVQIDVNRRIKRAGVAEEEIESYFVTGLNKWSELNLTIPFTEFYQQIDKKAKTLAQVVHHQQDIFDALINAIDLGNELSSVAVLDLLIQFVRDLQSDFEPFITQTIDHLVPLTRHSSVETIEATFTTFAYLFKYLDKVLAANPIPVFDAFAVLLGRDEVQRVYVTRFAAESLSFLLRRTRAQVQTTFTNHIVGDLIDVATKQYNEGISLLISDCVKGVDHSIHARGLAFLSSLLSAALETPGVVAEGQITSNLIEYVTISLLHHCTRETYAPILSKWCDLIQSTEKDERDLGWRLCFLSCAVRKGTRIQDWAALLDLAYHGLDTSTTNDQWHAVKLVSVLMTYAPHEALLPISSRLVTKVMAFEAANFLSLAMVVAKQNPANFEHFILSQYRTFVNQSWNAQNRQSIMRSLIVMDKLGVFQSQSSATIDGRLRLQESIGQDIAASLDTIVPSLHNQATARRLVHVAGIVVGSERLSPVLLRLLARCLESRSSSLSSRQFAVLIGQILHLLARTGSLDKVIISGIVVHTGLWRSSHFLRGFAQLIQRNSDLTLDVNNLSILLTNLSEPGHLRRLYSLQILQSAMPELTDHERDLLSVCEIIEATDLTIDASRGLALQIRKLNQNYISCKHDTVRKTILRFMMGLMTTNFTPFWSFCSETFSIIAKKDPDAVWEHAMSWLLDPSQTLELQEKTQAAPSRPFANEEAILDCFRCFNTAELQQTSLTFHHDASTPDDADLRDYTHLVEEENPERHAGKRSQAIRIMAGIIDISEQRSRELVPVFLSQFQMAGDEDEEEEEMGKSEALTQQEDDDSELINTEAQTTSHEAQSQRTEMSSPTKYSKKERNDLLALFSKFNNPAALLYADKVRETVMALLSSRDSRTQKLALDIILHYRDQNLKRYEDNMRNLLSDNRSRDEITTFLQTNSDDSEIQDEHRRHVMPVVARILYGKMINRRHANSQKKGLSNSRTVILSAVATLPVEDIGEFVHLFLRPFSNLEVVSKSGIYSVNNLSLANGPSLRLQIGFCTMLQDATEQLANKVTPFLDNILDALIYCFVCAADIIDSTMETAETRVTIKIARSIRHSIYQTLNLLFTHCREYNWSPYMTIIFNHMVIPRLPNLAAESSQNPSGLLRMLGNWASHPSSAPYLVLYNDNVLLRVFDCLAEKSLKDPVAIFVLRLVENLCEQVVDESTLFSPAVRQALLKDKVMHFLDRMSDLLENQQITSTNNTINSDFLELEVSVLSAISPLVSGGIAIQKLLDLLMPLLQKPRKLISDVVKENILQIVVNFLPHSEDYLTVSESLWKKYRAIGGLFSTSHSREARQALCKINRLFVVKDQTLLMSADLIDDLNSYSQRRLDTPDFDRRLAAFGRFNEQQYADLDHKAWRPVLHNMIFFIGDEEELALRTNATYSLRRLFEMVKSAKPDSKERELYLRLLETDLYPAIKKGVRHKLEIIRQEWVGLLGNLVRECSFWEQVSDMTPLLVGNDEEANFFYNILHIQQHRRMRALRRLATLSENDVIHSSNIAQIILPLIEHYCFAPKAESHNLIAEAIRTIGILAKSLTFNQYSALLKRYIGLLRSADELQATIVRLVGAVVDALVGTTTASTELVDYLQDEVESNDDTDAVALPTTNSAQVDETDPGTTVLLSSLPTRSKVEELVNHAFLPPLIKYLHSKDDSTVSFRIPAAYIVVKLLSFLPSESLTMKLPGVLTDVCHILRSRSQDARDMTRKTLGSIATLLGPKYFSYILAELKSALQRGYQLHVLGFSIHTILVNLQADYGTLDYCVVQIVDMLIDDIFGETGAEKDAEEYITKMKEMKATKSYDSFELLAASTSLVNLGEILWPLRILLAETSSLKVLRKVDEVFRRLTLGIMRNKECGTRESLLLCYNLYDQTIKSTQTKTSRSLTINEQARQDSEKNYIVDLKARKGHTRDHFGSNAHKLVKFSLETLRMILSKHTSLQTAENLAAFIPIIGDSMLSNYEDVHISALRLLTRIINLDLGSLDSGAAVFLEQAVRFIRASPSTKSEICQAALKFISAILRERKSVSVKDSVLAYLLIRIKADIEEPDRQGVTFTILRSIMTRKFMVPELYDIMDEVGSMMITNQSSGPRDMARSAYHQFLLDYPQGKGRLRKQMNFLIKNLEYIHASGRKSVMESLNLIISHFDVTILHEFIVTLHIACTMAMINDDEAECREMAGTLVRRLIAKADESIMGSIVAALKSWAYHENSLFQRASMQGFGLLFDVRPAKADETRFFMEKLKIITNEAAAAVECSEDDPLMEHDTQWQIIYYGLQTFQRLLTASQNTYVSEKYAKLWADVRTLLLYRHAWVRLSSARLIGIVFVNRQASSKPYLLAGAGLMFQDSVLVRISRQSLIQLRSPLLSEAMGTQITKNLIFLLRFFTEKKTILPPRDDVDIAEQDANDEQDESEAVTCSEWLLNRVAVLLQSDRDVKRETHFLVRRLLIQFMAAAIQSLPNEHLQSSSMTLAKPLYKYAESQTHNGDQIKLKDMAIEVFELLKQKIGQTKFAEVYNAVRQAQMAVRQERKQKRTIENVRFPERGAMKKVKASAKKRDRRAEQSHENKRRREMRS